MQEFTYLSSDGKTTLGASLWLPQQEPYRGIVQICHGMVEHMGRYEWLAGQLTDKGYIVCGDDHLGHGRSADNQTLGYFGERDGWRHLVEDEHLLRLLMQKQYPSMPYYLLGHSMGSFITREYITQYAAGLKGYICCGTSGRNPLIGFALVLSNVMVALQGGKHIGRLLNRLAFQNYNRHFGEVVTGVEWLSRDAAQYLPFANDPKCHFTFTNAGFRDLFRLLHRVSGKQWSNRVPKELPILILSGEEDPVGNYGKGVRQVYGWLKKSGIHALQLKLYPEARHELHNELNRDEFVEDVLAFLSCHSGTES